MYIIYILIRCNLFLSLYGNKIRASIIKEDLFFDI